jgi:Domain of unknown function (DUF5642)
MSKYQALFAVACAGLLAACSSGESSDAGAGSGSVDIAKISEVKGSFGSDFKVTDVPTTGIDKKVLAAQKLPEGMKFDPADCAAFAAGQSLPADIEGNMAAVTAEGAGQRFIAIAMQTSTEIPVNAPTDNCNKVSFAGGTLRGTVEAVPAPQIDGVQTLGVHRVLQARINGRPQTGEIYNYLAHFGDSQVIVTANPLVLPGKPPVPVDIARAEKLLVDAVAAVRVKASS